MSIGEYLSYLSRDHDDPFDGVIRSRVEIWPKEWCENIMCYRDPGNPGYCYTNFEPSSFCQDNIRIG